MKKLIIAAAIVAAYFKGHIDGWDCYGRSRGR